MLTSLVVLLLAAPQPSVAIPPANCSRIDAAVCDSMVERFVAQLSDRKIKVVSARDMNLLLGLERQKQMLGCSDSNGCLAELSGALGVDGLISISITRTDPFFVATVRALKVKDGSTWASDSVRVSREGELFDAMDNTAQRFANTFLGLPQVSDGPPRALTLIPGLVGLGALGAGIGTFVSAADERNKLTNHEVSGTAAATVADTGKTKEALGVGLMIGGGAVAIASTVWFLATGSSTASVAVVPTKQGGFMTVTLELP